MAAKNLQDVLDAAPQHGRAASQLADRRLRVSGRARRVLQLAPRAARLARDRGAVRPVAPHGEPVHARPRRDQADLRHRDQQRRELPASTRPSSTCRRRPQGTSSATASCSTWPRTSTSSSAARRRRTGCSSTPRPAATTSRSSKDDRSPIASDGAGGHARLLALPDPGPERLAGHREASTAARSSS